MLIKSSNKVKLPKSYYKILSLFPAFDNTFVFFGLLGLNKDCITHVDKNGHILFEQVFQKPIHTIYMINDRECVFLETMKKWNFVKEEPQLYNPCITVLDLETHTFTRIPHQFLSQQPLQSIISYFPQTKLVCVQQQLKEKYKLKLTYYQQPLTPESKPVNIYESKAEEWSKEYDKRTVNQHSMVAWFKPKHHEEWMFKTYELDHEYQGIFRTHHFSKNIGTLTGYEKAGLTIESLWQTTPGCFMIVTTPIKEVVDKTNSKIISKVYLVLDTMTKTMRQAKFSVAPVRDHIIWQAYAGPVSIFRVFDISQGRPKQTPVYFVDNQKQEIVGKDSWQFNVLHKIRLSWVEPGLLIHNQYEDGGCDWFVCEAIKIVQPKEISMQLMLAMNDNFDDDLLQDVTEIIDYEM